MKLANPRLVRLGGLTRGAIIEPGDGELIVSPVIQPVIELASPISVTGQPLPTSAPWQDDSFAATSVISINGAQAQTFTTIVGIKAGSWSFTVALSAHFTGTTNQTKAFYVLLSDPSSGTGTRVLANPFFTGRGVNDNVTFILTPDKDGWTFQTGQDATVAGDLLHASLMIIGRRLL